MISLSFIVLPCLLYTSDAADEEDSVDLGGRRIINIWNSLPNCVVDVSTINQFKARLDKFWLGTHLL